jgi:hypothetical protein
MGWPERKRAAACPAAGCAASASSCGRAASDRRRGASSRPLCAIAAPRRSARPASRAVSTDDLYREWGADAQLQQLEQRLAQLGRPGPDFTTAASGPKRRGASLSRMDVVEDSLTFLADRRSSWITGVDSWH